MDIVFIFYSLLAIFLVCKVIAYKNALKAVGTAPIMRVPCAPFSLFGALLPTSRFNPGMTWQWEWRNQVYRRYGSETIAMLPFLFGRPSLYTSSLETARQMLSTKSPFEKAPDATAAVLQYGTNIFAANGNEWRRHRRIIGPAFNNEIYASVWQETASTYYEMTADEGWNGKTIVDIPALRPLTSKFALIILSRCGFGNPFPWNAPDHRADAMSFGEALEVVSDSFIIRLLTPRWMYMLPIPSLQKIDIAHKILSGVMRSLISAHRESLRSNGGGGMEDRKDVFSLIVSASETDGKLTMSDEELVGNTFFLLFAGHETMAHIWNATIGFLALYEDAQEEAYREVVAVAPGDTPITFSMSTKLEKVLACFLETGRLFPPGFVLMRDTTDDVVLTTYDEHRVESKIALSRGVRVAVDMVGLHYNPRHFPEPEEYRPSRWYDVPESEHSFYSIGPRACTGRKFANTEACCFLAHLLREWRLKIVLRPGESRQQWRARVLRAKATMTLGVGDVPVQLVRR